MNDTKPTIYKVGEPIPDWANLPSKAEGVYFNAWNGDYAITMLYDNPTQTEINAMKKERVEFRYQYDHINQIIWLFFRFSGQPWQESTYNWHINAIGRNETDLWRPDSGPNKLHQLFTIILADFNNGIVKAIRAVTAPPHFINSLNRDIIKQSGDTFNMAEYNKNLDRIQSTYTTDHLAKNYKQRFASKQD